MGKKHLQWLRSQPAHRSVGLTVDMHFLRVMRDSLHSVWSSSNANLKALPGGQDTYRGDHSVTGNRATAAFSRRKPPAKGSE